MPRRPSASAHRKVLDAAFQLMAERGIEGTSMDAIAEASGVSKATIYKHWADKDALLLEMMAEANGLHNRPRLGSGSTRTDMLAVLSHRPPERAEFRERIMPHFIAYSARNPAFGKAWRHMVMEPPRKELRHLLVSGIEKGEFSPELDPDLSLALLLGPMLYGHIFLNGKKATGHPEGLAEGVIDAFWKAFARRDTVTEQ